MQLTIPAETLKRSFGICRPFVPARTMVVKNTKGETLRTNVLKNVDRSATVYTDALVPTRT